MADGTDLAAIGKGIGDIFINLSAEYPTLLNAIIFIFAAVGVVISSTAIFEIIKNGRRDSMSYSPTGAFWWKMIGGASLVDLAFWAKVWSDSLWSMSEDIDISAYVASGGEDYTKTAVMAALGIFVIGGYVVLGKAYIATTRLGYLSPEARSDLIGGIVSRIVAGSLMISALHVSKILESSTGFNWIPT